VSIVGNKHIKTDKLLKELRFAEGDFFDFYLINQGIETLKEAYKDKGYYFASVELNDKSLKGEGKIIYVIVEGPKGRVKKVYFEGNKSFPRGKLKKQIKTSSYFPIFRKGRIDTEKLDQDNMSLTKFYHDEGYLDARVFWDMQLNKTRTRATVRFVIEEGLRYKVSAIEFSGNQKFRSAELQERIKLESGDVLTEEDKTLAVRTITRVYGKEGYIYTSVQPVLRYTEEPGQVDMIFKVAEGDPYNLGRLIVKGNYQTKDKVIRRDFDRHGFLPGALYDTVAVEKAERRLKGSGLFEDLTITPIGDSPSERDALVEVTEARTGLLLFGVGVDTNSGVMGQISLEQRNFDASRWPESPGELFGGDAFIGGGQRMRIDFEPGTRVTRGRFNFYEPYLFDQPYYLDLNLFIFRRWRESYLERRYGGTVTLGRRFDNDWSIEGTARVEVINVTDLDEGWDRDPNGDIIPGSRHVVAPQDVQDVEGDNLLTSLKFGVGRDTTDRMFRPTEGYKINASWEQVGSMGGDFNYSALTTGGTIFRTIYTDITERRTVWASRLQGSQIILGDAPMFERYYAGGIGTLRGFDYRGVSPRAGINRDPIGSDYIVLAGTEVTHPLLEETIFGKVFCDNAIIDEGPVRVTVGFGLELVVPQLFQMIPMHFDFGFPVIKDDEDDPEVFSFNFGMNF
jgi:outer membrane protein insertion porin family